MIRLLMSKRFWLSVLVVLGTVGNVVPPKIAVYISAAGSILTKLIDMNTTSLRG